MKIKYKLFLLLCILCLLFYRFIYSINIDNNNYKEHKDDVYFLLNIPKIDLFKKVYNFNSEKNDVDKGLFLATSNSLLNGSTIVASHSGNSPISYFDSLDKLDVGDTIFVYKNGYIYCYDIVSKYFIIKNGKFKYDDYDDLLYLITCDKNNHTKQLVVEGKLTKISKKSTFFRKMLIFFAKKKEIGHVSDISISVEGKKWHILMKIK